MKFRDVTIRKATEADAHAVALVHYKAWIQTYTGMLPDKFLATRSVEKSRDIFLKTKCANLVVAEVSGEIVGFCGWREFRDREYKNNIGEIQGIYLLDGYKRNNIGQKMLEYAIGQLRVEHQKAGLWVLKENINAIGFYEKMGFEYSGINKEADFGEPITELLYLKEL